MLKFTYKILFVFFIFPSFALATSVKDSNFADDKNKYKKNMLNLMKAKNIKCYFPKGVLARWEKKGFKLDNDSMTGASYFDSIDFSKNKARLVGNMGATDVKAWLFPSGISFVEMTPAGNIMHTTIFPVNLGDKNKGFRRSDESLNFKEAYLAVLSRHIFAPGIGAMPSQFYGYCMIME